MAAEDRVGIFFAINFLIASTARLVYLTRENLPYTWVPIAWRAGSSWMVAIALISMMFALRPVG